jgi:hypothetical protein
MIKVGKFLWIITFFCVVVWADQAPEKKVVYKKSETHKFEGLKLKGEFKKPDLSYIYQRKGIRSEQIVDIPDNFNSKIREDAERF